MTNYERDPWVEYWMKQPEEYRRAAKFGHFLVNQPELPIGWESPSERLKMPQEGKK